ncbi:MAG: aldehyde ferredoxin oxidoreductase C-terminal domain-containing protein [Candidatus Hodarchaeales archaeon]|jgi:aldehyde:ferredoxin oxidoreductase
MFGYMGKILRVNLSTGQITEEFPGEDTLRMYLGGAGLATKYLIDEVPKRIDPLSPENKLIFMTGPMTGTSSPSTGRYSVVTKSPLTGFWGQANSGGFFGRDFKRSGYDGVIFEGVSEKPVYLITDGGKAELRDASHLWGKNTSETTRILREELGEKFNVACIGIAGENLVKYAAIMNDANEPNWGRAAGRCGVGTVMGSKNLKAIASRGKAKVLVADKEKYKEAAKNRFDWVNQSLLKMTLEVFGTAAMLDLVNEKGGFPTRNFQTGVFKKADLVNGEAINDNILVERKPCFACPIHCGRISEIKTGKYTSKGEGPEFESLCSLGSVCDIDDLEAITYAHFLCNEYGIDTISTGVTISFALECYEKELLTKNETDGLELKFGDPDVMIELIHRIAKREGNIGNLLAEGSKAVSQKLGKGTERFAINVKGLELPAYDPRAAKIAGLGFATANRGGDHMTSFIEGPAFLDMPFLLVDEGPGDGLETNPKDSRIVKEYEDAFGIFDSVGGCKFMGMVLTGEDWAELIAILFGWEDFKESDFRKTGERIYNLQRIYNIREGLTRADDTLPRRLLEEPLPEGPAKGHTVDLEPLLDAYYEYRGWDNNGIPTVEKIEELGLDWLIPEIDIARGISYIEKPVERIISVESSTDSETKIASTTVLAEKMTYAEKPWEKSYKVGPYALPKTMAPYPEIPVTKFLDDAAREYPDNISYFIAGDHREELTYAELKLKVDKLATALHDLGVRKGDRVATILPTCFQFVISDYAIMSLGAVHVPLSILHQAPELLHEIKVSGAEDIICSYRRLERINSIKNDITLKNVIFTQVPIFPDYSFAEIQDLPNIPNLCKFEDLIEKYDPNPPVVKINPKEDLALLPFTGGTTGVPKATMLTHYNITTNIIQSLHWVMHPLKDGIKGKAAALICFPIFHQAGHYFLHAGISWGLRGFLIDGRDLSLIVEIINKYRPFMIGGVPTHYMLLLENPDLQKMPCFFYSGAAALPTDVAEKWEEKVGTPLSEGFGMTETCAVTHMNPSGLSKVTGFMSQAKRSVGVPVADTEVKIVDLETSIEVPFGESGEMWIRGPQVMLGYWPTPGTGLEEGGWLATGDIAKMDEDGYFFIVDRIKDMINVSGMKVYSQTVDDVLHGHPAVAVAGVIGVSDPDRPGSERVKAFIALKPTITEEVTAEGIINYCQERLPPYAVPNHVEFRDMLPLTPVMKIDKKKLREEELHKIK